MKRIVRRVRVKKPEARNVASQGNGLKLIDQKIVSEFNPTLLKLGDINSPCKEIEAVTAVFDLTGFTRFCNQVDSYLAIPKFLNDFLESHCYAMESRGICCFRGFDAVVHISSVRLPNVSKYQKGNLVVPWLSDSPFFLSLF